MKVHINTLEDLSRLYDGWCNVPPSLPCTVEILEGLRSLPQNNLSFKVYSRIAEHMDRDKVYARNYCKLIFGAPILRRDDTQFETFCQKGLDKLTHPDQIEAMEFTPITSIMNKKQKSEYLEDVMNSFTLKHSVPFADLTNGD